MPAFSAIYTPEQREAVAIAVVDRGIRPAQRVCDLAAAGELELDGARLEPFNVPVNTVRDAARKLRARRAGELRSKAAKLPPRDALEAMRRRLVSLCDRELTVLERKKAGTVKAEQLRQMARVAREIAAIPGPDDPRPPQPGQRDTATGKHNGSRTQGGLAGAILNAAEGNSPRLDASTGTATETPHNTETDGGDRARSSTADDALVHGHDESPGGWARAQVGLVAGLGGDPEHGA